MGHISCEKGTRPSHLSAALKAIDSFQYDKTALQIEQNVLYYLIVQSTSPFSANNDSDKKTVCHVLT